MKLQLDFDKKTIKIEGDVKLDSFFDKIKKILPDWKKWKLETNTQIVGWGNPVYIDRYPIFPYAYPYWWSGGYGTTTGTITGTSIVDCDISTTTGGADAFTLTGGTYGSATLPTGIVNMEIQ